jgi:hypothetical protein
MRGGELSGLTGKDAHMFVVGENEEDLESFFATHCPDFHKAIMEKRKKKAVAKRKPQHK